MVEEYVEKGELGEISRKIMVATLGQGLDFRMTKT